MLFNVALILLVVGLFFGLLFVMFGKKKPTDKPFELPKFELPSPAARQLTAREQDKAVQADLIAKWFAEQKDEQFRKATLAELAEMLK